MYVERRSVEDDFTFDIFHVFFLKGSGSLHKIFASGIFYTIINIVDGDPGSGEHEVLAGPVTTDHDTLLQPLVTHIRYSLNFTLTINNNKWCVTPAF